MKCSYIQSMMSSYLDNELDNATADLVEVHVSKCSECRKMMDELSVVKNGLKSLPLVETPEFLHSRIMQGIHEERKKVSKRFLFRVGRWAPALACALVLIMVMSVWGNFWPWGDGNGFDLFGKKTAPEGDLQTYGHEEYLVAPDAEEIPNVAESQKADRSMTSQWHTLGFEHEQMMITQATITLEVPEGQVIQTSQNAVSTVELHQGYIESSTMSFKDGQSRTVSGFYMTARVPANKMEVVKQEICQLGQVINLDASSQDVTDTYIDLNARLRNKEAQEQRLLTILGEAKTVGELLQVENELSRVRGDIESLRGKINYYDKSVALSCLSVKIDEEGSGTARPPSAWEKIWKAFVEAVQALMIFIARIAPTLIVVAVLAIIAVRLLRRKQQ